MISKVDSTFGVLYNGVESVTSILLEFLHSIQFGRSSFSFILLGIYLKVETSSL